jgi:hypothetical protein
MTTITISSYTVSELIKEHIKTTLGVDLDERYHEIAFVSDQEPGDIDGKTSMQLIWENCRKSGADDEMCDILNFEIFVDDLPKPKKKAKKKVNRKS